jgi:hypothetical protein
VPVVASRRVQGLHCELRQAMPSEPPRALID